MYVQVNLRLVRLGSLMLLIDYNYVQTDVRIPPSRYLPPFTRNKCLKINIFEQ